MGKFQDLSGQTFGRWTVLNKYKSIKKRVRWFCQCKCGNKKFVTAACLKDGRSKSCGCYAKENKYKIRTTHGMKGSPEYISWQSIKTRCLNKNRKCYKNYGGRGIRVCDRWLNSFENFYKDMGPRPSPKHSIDRIDVNGNYCPENCKWATRHQQAINHRNNKKYIGVKIQKNKYYSVIYKDGKSHYLGTFKTDMEAAVAYDDKCEEFYGYRPNKTERAERGFESSDNNKSVCSST